MSSEIVQQEIEVTQGLIDDLANIALAQLSKEITECSMVDYLESLTKGFREIEDLEKAVGKAILNDIMVKAISAKMEHDEEVADK